VAKNFIDSDFIKVKFLFKPSEVRKAELQRTYDRLIKRAANRCYDSRIHEHHHIIPRSLGGKDVGSNVAVLTYDEHFLAHWLLTRLTTGLPRIQMLNALNHMSSAGRNQTSRNVSGWQYALARQAQSEAQRLRYEQPEAVEILSQAQLKRYAKMTEEQLKEKNQNISRGHHRNKRRKAYCATEEGKRQLSKNGHVSSTPENKAKRLAGRLKALERMTPKERRDTWGHCGRRNKGRKRPDAAEMLRNRAIRNKELGIKPWNYGKKNLLIAFSNFIRNVKYWGA
jgi:hypothetical protein